MGSREIWKVIDGYSQSLSFHPASFLGLVASRSHSISLIADAMDLRDLIGLGMGLPLEMAQTSRLLNEATHLVWQQQLAKRRWYDHNCWRNHRELHPVEALNGHEQGKLVGGRLAQQIHAHSGTGRQRTGNAEVII